MTDAKTEAESWEEGCQGDDRRNLFVIPNLVSHFSAHAADRILDVGSGTGYTARSVQQRLPYAADWTLVDFCRERLALAEALRPADMRQTCESSDFIDQFVAHVPYDAALLTFTLLEIPDIHSCLDKLAVCLRAGGYLLIALPDSWQDVWDEAGTDPSKFEAFLDGAVALHKIDKFTGEPYPFQALRIEFVIAAALRAGFELMDLRASTLPDFRAYFMAFRRDAGGRDV